MLLNPVSVGRIPAHLEDKTLTRLGFILEMRIGNPNENKNETGKNKHPKWKNKKGEYEVVARVRKGVAAVPQGVASVLQGVATRRNVSQHVATCRNVSQRVAQDFGAVLPLSIQVGVTCRTGICRASDMCLWLRARAPGAYTSA